MPTSLEQEIRELRSRFWSARDPDGRGFVPLADALRRAGELDEAHALLTDGLGRLPDFTSAHLVASWVHRDRGDLTAAEESCRMVLALDPENARALHALGHLLARAGRLAAGRELVVRGVEIDPLLEWEEGRGAALAVVDVRELAPRSPDGILGFVAGRGPVVDIDFLAPAPAVATPPAAEPDDAGARHGELQDPWAPAEPEPEAAPEPEPASEPVPALEAEPETPTPIEHLAPSGLFGAVVDIAELAPDVEAAAPSEGRDASDEPGAVQPTARADAGDAPSATHEGDEGDEVDEGDVTYTRTMLDLLVRQGLHAQALEVGGYLLRRNPHDEALRARIRELEVGAPAPDAPAEAPAETRPDESDQPPADADAEPGVADYLDDLLSWSDDGPEDR